MTATVVIPARIASTRFPEKILAAETGRPLVQHVVDQAKKAKRVREVIVAADDQRIIDALKSYETRAVLTSAAHQSGSDRIAEVARSLSDDIIVNVQADEPEIEPETIDGLIELLQKSEDDMATVATPFPAGADPDDANLVKVVESLDHRAIYFSRSRVPFHRDGNSRERAPYYLHLGIYAYRRQFLLQYAGWPPTPLEQAEKLEQLRALEHGRTIRILTVARATHGIDTRQQYDEFVKRWKQKR